MYTSESDKLQGNNTASPITQFAIPLYNAHGLSIVPLQPGGKVAVCKWEHLQKERMPLSELKSWGTRELYSTTLPANYNYGIITGKLSGIVVVDADDAAAVQYVREHLPYTPIQVTSRKGCHFYYKYPTEGLVSSFQGGTLNGHKIDIRAQGGLVVGPGSIHASGAVYQFSGNWAKWSEMPMYNPAWLVPDKAPARTVNPEAVATWGNADDDCSFSLDERLATWREILAHKPGAKQGQGAIKYTFAIAIDGIHGCCLSVDEALPDFARWGTKSSNQDSFGGYYPWSEKELIDKLEGAAAIQPNKPRGWLLPAEALVSEKRLSAALGIDASSEPSNNTSFFEELATARKPVAAPGVSTAPTAAQKPLVSSYEFRPITSAEFNQNVYNREWLVKNILVAEQPAIVGGPKKALKTSAIVDIGISIGTGLPYLGKFAVPKKRRVAIISGESGEKTLQETARRVCKAKSISLDNADVIWDFRLPQLSVAEELAALGMGLYKHKVEVAIIDPLYLCLLSGGTADAANLYEIGPLLSSVSRICLAAGATPILVHHAKKFREHQTSFAPLDLDDLSFAGVQEFARQWLLLSRREKYQPGSGKHNLWMTAGGSAGHGGLWGVDIDEGQMDEDFGGRVWKCNVLSADAIKEERAKVKEQQDAAEKNEERDEMIATIQGCSGQTSVGNLRSCLGWYGPKFDRTLKGLVKNNLAELYQGCVKTGNGASRKAECVRLLGT